MVYSWASPVDTPAIASGGGGAGNFPPYALGSREDTLGLEEVIRTILRYSLTGAYFGILQVF